MIIEIEFACACGRQSIDIDKTPSPVCLSCGESKVARTFHVPPPRFVGCVTGPYAVTKALAPMAVKVGLATLEVPSVVPAADAGAN